MDPATGEVVDAPDVARLREELAVARDQIEGMSRKLAAAAGQNTKLKRELSEAMGVEPGAAAILEVLSYWRDLCKREGASLSVGSARWLKVRARLRERDVETKEPRFNVLKLKAAVVGITLSGWHMDSRYPHRRDLDMAFSDGDKVERLIGGAVGFKRRTGVSALAVVDELAGAGLGWLADRCSCGHLWVAHLRGGPRPDGTTPCCQCGCESMDLFHAKVERWKAERERNRG